MFGKSKVLCGNDCARKVNHLSDLRRGTHSNLYLQHTYNLYGENALSFIVIEDNVPQSNLAYREIFWVNFLEAEFNIATPGSAPMLGRKHTNEVRERIRIAATGRRATPEAILNMQKAQRGYPKHSIEVRARMSAMRKGKQNSLGRKLSEETKEKIRVNNGLQKPIKQIDPATGEVIKIWRSISEAGRGLSIDISHISNVAKKKPRCKTSHGWKWEYAT
jgi:group I intron endonuclease